MKMRSVFALVLFFCSASCGLALGLFDASGDIGAVKIPGEAAYDTRTRTYTLTASGENMWGTADAFHYLWKKMDSDILLTADVHFVGEGKNSHRKACLVFRQSLAADAVYADVALHGDGLTSLQYRATPGGITEEIVFPATGFTTLSLHKKGDRVMLYVAHEGEEFRKAGEVEMPFSGPIYAGLAVCAHEADLTETALFTNVHLLNMVPQRFDQRKLESTLETIHIDTGERQVIYKAWDHFEAPNWSKDGTFLIFNSQGRLYRIQSKGGSPQLIDTGFADRCNNDHGLSPDGQTLAISHNTSQGSIIYTVPLTGGTPTQVTDKAPSYWHGWSPDGKTLVYCAERNGDYDVYAIPAAGGEEIRLTTAPGLDDGPEYAPDGSYIYFNSVRTGTMQIWRMRLDGSEQEQLTQDEYNDWFAHPSPDGKHLIFVSYEKDVEGHPANKRVMLRLMPSEGGEPRILTRLYGGQGTMNVPSWSPDATRAAFVSYRFVYP
ncbi:MAG: hypothetical protein RBU29_16230 [bacterium]|jgi:Tol biopolymer transport system component|nr:hypothetical protein [bacterium]